MNLLGCSCSSRFVSSKATTSNQIKLKNSYLVTENQLLTHKLFVCSGSMDRKNIYKNRRIRENNYLCHELLGAAPAGVFLPLLPALLAQDWHLLLRVLHPTQIYSSALVRTNKVTVPTLNAEIYFRSKTVNRGKI